MNKGELIDAIANDTGMSRSEAERAVNSVISTISGELKKGNDISLVGFGTFKVAHRGARTAKNPQTGAAVKVAARKVPKFTPGKGLKDTVNGAKGAAKKGAAGKAAGKATAAKGAAKKGGAATKASKAPAKGGSKAGAKKR